MLDVDILDPICKMITGTNTDRFGRQSATKVLLKLAKYGRTKHSRVIGLLTFPADSVRSDILNLKLVESLESLLGNRDSDMQFSAAKALLGIAKLAKYGNVKRSHTAITHVWKQMKSD
jgi:hypothetical protein